MYHYAAKLVILSGSTFQVALLFQHPFPDSAVFPDGKHIPSIDNDPATLCRESCCRDPTDVGNSESRVW